MTSTPARPPPADLARLPTFPAGPLAEQARQAAAAASGLHNPIAEEPAETAEVAQIEADSYAAQVEALSDQLGDTYEELSLIYRLSASMQIDRPPGRLSSKTRWRTSRASCRSAGRGVAFWDSRFGEIPAAGTGDLRPGEGDWPKLETAVRERLAAAGEPGPLLLNEPTADSAFAWLGGRVKRLLAVPLVRQDRVIGGCWVIDKADDGAPTGDVFTSIEAKLLAGVATGLAVFAENVRFYQDSQGLLMGLLHALTSAVDAKDAYTCGHSERVALLSRELAGQAGYGEPFCERIYMAGLLHDVGKIGVPDTVIRKAGKADRRRVRRDQEAPGYRGPASWRTSSRSRI